MEGKLKIKLLLLCLFALNVQAKTSLSFLDFNIIPNKTIFQKSEIGGLSGLDFNQKTNQLFAVSDQPFKSRVYSLDLDIKSNKMLLEVSNVIFLSQFLDLESIALFENDSFYVSTEQTLTRPPEILKFSNEGKLLENIDIPKVHIKNSRKNRQLESLALSPSNDLMFFANEDTLKKDGLEVSFQNDGVVRIEKFKRKKKTYVADGTYFYKLEKIPYPKNNGLSLFERISSTVKRMKLKENKGLVDILAINDKKLLTLERTWLPSTKKQIIEIFEINFDEYQEVQNRKNLNKKLLLNLSKIAHLLPDDLDNFEGMTLGPKLKSGNDSLILVSDNNFNPAQKTIFLLFELIQK